MSVAPLVIAGFFSLFLTDTVSSWPPRTDLATAGHADALPPAPSRHAQVNPLAQADEAFFAGRWKDALDAYASLLSRDPDNWLLWARIGQCRLALGEAGPGLSALEKSVTLNTNSVNASLLAAAHKEIAQRGEALRWARTALKLYVEATAADRASWRTQSKGVLAPMLVVPLCADIVELAADQPSADESLPELLGAAAGLAPEGAEKTAITDSQALLYAARGDYRNASRLLGEARRIGIQMEQRPVAEGIRIRSVSKGMPADLAGLRTGDVITDVAGQSLRDALTTEALAQAIGGAPFGSTVTLTVLRAGERLRKNVIVGVPPNLAELATASAASPAPQPAPAATPAPSISISRLEIKPNPVPAGVPFAIEYEYAVNDAAAAAAQIEIETSYSISQGGTVLYTRPVEKVTVPNGSPRLSVEHLNPSSQTGRYTVTVSLRHGRQAAERSAEFLIK